MLLTRVISAVIGIIIGVLIIFVSDTIIFPIAISAFAAVIVFELLSNCDCLKYKIHSFIAIFFAAVYPFLHYVLAPENYYVFSVGCLFVMIIAFVLKNAEMKFEKLAFMVTVSYLVTLSINSFTTLINLDQTHGPYLIYFTLFAAFFNDSAAFFVGCSMGKHKLCPNISPKKTIEGAVGGAIISVIVLALATFVYDLIFTKSLGEIEVNYVTLCVVGLISAVLGIVGDLTAYIIKRQNNIKDFGKIMPGHGGVLDRFDGVLLILPFMAIALKFFPLFK